ncbi:hypothetical protein M8C21_026822 [Ambrosia artemisiifolia]|uniref:Uncharacterized protein n=1 Tax=Ambrosia artemisiifolia TaxID=4212 RepID=A0AAD5GI48_AMBAR|nr:hypothetical protein M8C21_026822 [Ambrosia artemisiifolia]
MLTIGDDNSVPRWDEDTSTPFQKYRENKRDLTIGYIGDEWDEEYDKGKRKKVRISKTEFDGKNPFQDIANERLKSPPFLELIIHQCTPSLFSGYELRCHKNGVEMAEKSGSKVPSAHGRELNEQLLEIVTQENFVKQHSKVAEGVVSGWEKAEAEAATLKSHLESVTLLKLTAKDRASHLDGALKECMRQITNLKEEHEQ